MGGNPSRSKRRYLEITIQQAEKGRPVQKRRGKGRKTIKWIDSVCKDLGTREIKRKEWSLGQKTRLKLK